MAYSHEELLRVMSEEGAEEYRRELKAERDEIGSDRFRQKYGATQHALNPLSRIQKAVLSETEREIDDGFRLAEADRGAEMVGHADNANRIAWWAIFMSGVALIVSVGALIASLIALRD